MKTIDLKPFELFLNTITFQAVYVLISVFQNFLDVF